MSNSKSNLVQWLEANAFPGLTPKTLKKHYSLIPVMTCIVTGLVWCAIFSTRTFLYNPDSIFLGRHSNERYRDGTYFKFVNVSGLKLKCQAPIYKREGDPDDDSYALPEY
ncbi:hypothetical protein PGB90_008109 [Kerria lacca]